MKFLADAGISPKTFAYLNTAGHDAVHVRQIGLQRATDVEIALRARQEGRIILTFDLDLDLDLDLDSLDSRDPRAGFCGQYQRAIQGVDP